LPKRSSTRAPSTSGHPAASASSGFVAAASPYPKITIGRRTPVRSESQPENPFKTLAVASASPSITPTIAIGAPSACVRNNGMRG
jgi:hypothetical protein